MPSPLIHAAKNNVNRDNLIVSIGCGIVLASLVMAFIIRTTN